MTSPSASSSNASFPGGDPASLEVSSATKRYGGTVALDKVSLRVEAGECVALVGESGSGKSTLLRSFNAMVSLDHGRVSVGGRDSSGWDPVALRRSMGYVPQEGGLIPHWTVIRNVALVPSLRRHADPEMDAVRALRRVGLPPEIFGDRWPRTLSGGQRQRVAIARALAAGPGIVLLDEPFGALDAITRSELQEEFDALRRGEGFTALLVTHDLREALRLADRVAVLRAGRLEQVERGPALRDDPATPYVRELLLRAGIGES